MDGAARQRGGDVVLAQFRPAWAEQAYLRLCKVPHHVENWSHPWSASSGRLPQLQAQHSIVPAERILRFLCESGHDLNAALEPAQRAQAVAFESLVRNELTLALQWSRWADDEHYTRVTRKALLQSMPFPMNRGWAWFERQAVLFRLGQHHRICSERSAQLVAAAAYEALDAQLGDGRWLFGERASTADCVLFGHLMDALREPIGSLVARHYPRLGAFCARVRRELFEEPSAEVRALSSSSPRANVFIELAGQGVVYDGSAVDHSSWGRVGRDGRAEARGSRESGQDDEVSAEEAALRAQEEEFQEGSRRAVMFAGVVLVGYLLVTNVVALQVLQGDEDEDDGEDEFGYEDEEADLD